MKGKGKAQLPEGAITLINQRIVTDDLPVIHSLKQKRALFLSLSLSLALALFLSNRTGPLLLARIFSINAPLRLFIYLFFCCPSSPLPLFNASAALV